MNEDFEEVRPTVDLVKQTITMVEVAEMLGYDPDRNDKIRPPWNESENTPSCHIYEDHWFDYSTGKGGDFIDFIQSIDPDMTFGKALWDTWRRALNVGKEPGDVEAIKIRVLEDFTEELQRYPTWCGVDQYGRHGDGSTMLIPHREPGRVYGVKTRAGRKAAWPGSQFTHRLYHPFGWSIDESRTGCLIAEGESDAWALTEQNLGVEVFALPSGAGAWKDHWMSDLERYESVWLCMDNDRAGATAREKLTRKIGFGRAENLRVPQLYNDAREAIEAGWIPVLN
tara:strand:- start:157 stop:1005 length:849 start_codon:yes stop_codon:yes gene_type:complete